MVLTNEWAGYSRLREDSFCHKTVKHSKRCVNPKNGVYTQGIERAWVEGKAIMKRHRRTTNLLQSHLDELSRRKRNRDSVTLLISTFWKNVYRVHELSSLE